MKRIILPTDFSQNALNANRYALRLLKDQECTFYLMNTYTPAIYQSEYVLHSPGQIGLGDIYQSDSQEQLEKLQKDLQQEFKNPKHTLMTHSAFNILVDEVISMTENEKANFIVMGTQGASGAKEIFLGTHTVHVIKKSKKPVLAIPAEYSFTMPTSILFPTDYEIDYQEDELSVLLDIANMTGAEIHVLHIASGFGLTDAQKKNKAALEQILAPLNSRFYDVPSQEIIEGINNFQKEHKVDLLAMVQNKHTFLERLFLEPIIKKIGFHVSIPFMVLPHM
ncbi:MAG: universal stress protein [Flavobacteriaceae bacterium]